MEIKKDGQNPIKIDNNSLSAFIGIYMFQLGTTSNTSVYVNDDASLTSITDAVKTIDEDTDADCFLVNDFNTDASIDIAYSIDTDENSVVLTHLHTIKDAAYGPDWANASIKFEKVLVENDLFIKSYENDNEKPVGVY